MTEQEKEREDYDRDMKAIKMMRECRAIQRQGGGEQDLCDHLVWRGLPNDVAKDVAADLTKIKVRIIGSWLS